MSEEKEVVNHMFSWSDSVMWTVVTMFVAGTVGRVLVSEEPFCARRFFGELILSVIGAILLYTFELMQGMNPVQMVFFGALGSMGGIRLIEWLIKVVKKVKSAGIL